MIECICLECGRLFKVYPSHFRRGTVKFCSISCGISYRNKIDNPSKHPDVRKKISLNHADVSGKNNPMFGISGKNSPGYIDGRNAYGVSLWRWLYWKYKGKITTRCEICGEDRGKKYFHVHHKDRDKNNNSPENLQGLCAKCHNMVAHKRKRNCLGQFQKEV